MATHTRAELPVVFDCNSATEGSLDVFRPPDRPAGNHAWPARRIARWPMVVPVVAVIAGAAVSWVGISAKSGPLPAVPGPPATSDISTALPSLSSKPVFVAPVTAPIPTEPAPATEPAPVRVDPAFERTLARVSQSYRALDAASLTAVWPGADTVRLSRAFADLKYQALSFDHCSVRTNGNAAAVASCDADHGGTEGRRSALQRRRESWTLLLDRSGERWTITGGPCADERGALAAAAARERNERARATRRGGVRFVPPRQPRRRSIGTGWV